MDVCGSFPHINLLFNRGVCCIMAMEFKKDYGSFEQRLGLFNKPTHWEIENGIKIVGQEVKSLSEDMKVVIIKKSDNTETMVLFYNGSKNSNPCWFGWMPSKEQMQSFEIIQDIYFKIDAKNKQNKNMKSNE